MGSGGPVLPSLPNNYLPLFQTTRYPHLQLPLHTRNIFPKRHQDDDAKNGNEGKEKSFMEMFKAGDAKDAPVWDMPPKFEQLTTSASPFPMPFNFPIKSMQQFPMPVFISSSASSSSGLLPALSSARPSINSFIPMLNLSPYNSLFNLAFSAAALANYKNRMRKDSDHNNDKDSPNGLSDQHKADIASKPDEMQDSNLKNCLNMRLFKAQSEMMKDKSFFNEVAADNIKRNSPSVEQ